MVKHNASRYRSMQGCRCEDCTADHRARHQRETVNRKLRLDELPAEAHGTVSTYDNWGCRCLPCGQANRQALNAGAEKRMKRLVAAMQKHRDFVSGSLQGYHVTPPYGMMPGLGMLSHDAALAHGLPLADYVIWVRDTPITWHIPGEERAGEWMHIMRYGYGKRAFGMKVYRQQQLISVALREVEQ